MAESFHDVEISVEVDYPPRRPAVSWDEGGFGRLTWWHMPDRPKNVRDLYGCVVEVDGTRMRILGGPYDILGRYVIVARNTSNAFYRAWQLRDWLALHLSTLADWIRPLYG